MLSISIKLIILILPLCSLSAFSSEENPGWNYRFDTYTNYGGIIESNKAMPMHNISTDILDSLLNSLPENQKAHESHPEYFPEPEPEIVLKDDGEVFVTFHHEGAGYKNALGYYTYDGNTNRTLPKNSQEIRDDGIILFPNTSLLHSGGDLVSGTTVSLGNLSKGTKVIFFLVSNAWYGNNIGVSTQTDWIFSSWSSLNLEHNPSSTKVVTDDKHVALLWKNIGPGNILLMGFEDILRTNNHCDHDFNDVLFSVSSSPMEAISDSIQLTTGESGFALAPEEKDTDEDGINDAFDAFPEDSQRAYISYYPNSTSKATLVFEDMWPQEGDYDMNDLSISFSIKEIKDVNHKVKEIALTGNLQSYGASYTNGFSLSLDTQKTNILSANMKLSNGLEYSILDDVRKDKETAIINIFKDAGIFMDKFSNVYKDSSYIQAETFELKIIFNTPVNLSSPPYNPFLVVTRYLLDENDYVLYDNIEVHLPNHAPTSHTPSKLFRTVDDKSDLDQNKTYLTETNKPWALLIPTYFAHPIEQVNIKDAYTHYLDWVKSDGQTYNDWYVYTKRNAQNKLYADENKIIIHP